MHPLNPEYQGKLITEINQKKGAREIIDLYGLEKKNLLIIILLIEAQAMLPRQFLRFGILNNT